MTEQTESTQTPNPPKPKKGVNIQIMFPCDSDEEAIHIKARIDHVVEDIQEKRYTFSISEV